ncbi:RIP metalloprotease RseP [Peloplasma aerotolerans]|uniref:RIP metalloprotease RseP n=1 Tax=Peloplasma aerotolerans TaxID=3044389 RepID=A0AAW6U4J0_9MOLU|nr:RIP metalloprotease RseP [Mariniplasma sp. M4Ah]MDI6452886.1 RIP metalloprotease RseP [Mariniplasma sp. M4Ah]
MFIFDLIIFILVLGVIILIHEAGHFYFAKKAGILCHEFSIGMGPALFQKRKGETMYSIRGIPIGGYVSMAGESINDALIRKEQVIGVKFNSQGHISQIILNDALPNDAIGIVKAYDLYGKDFDPLYIELEVDGVTTRYSVKRDAVYRMTDKKEMWITPSEKSFESKTLWQRFLVIFAGPLMNFILALVLFLIVGFFLLKPNTDSSEIDYVAVGSPAESIGLEESDIITVINGQNINTWDDLSNVMRSLNSVSLSLSYTREGITFTESDVVVSAIIQMAGITNRAADGTIYSDQAVVGQAFGRAKTDGRLEANDVIQSITVNGGTPNVINSWDDIIDVFRRETSGDLVITYLRGSEILDAEYSMISERALAKLGHPSILFQLGVSPTADFNLGYTLSYPFVAFYSNTRQVFSTLGLLFDKSENLGIGDLSGPVGIFSLVSSTTSQGFVAILGFTAFLSINIGLLNLLPIPALDGGRLVFLGIEAVTRKPLNKKLENTINNVMFFLLLGLFVFVTYNDILRLIRG